jgi:hypothetical protein
MGVSRVFLGHHWLTDVLVAWTLGLAWLVVVITAHRLFLTVRRAGASVDASTPGDAPPTGDAPPAGEAPVTPDVPAYRN